MVTTGAIRRAKLQSNCHHQQTNTQFFTGQMPFLLPQQQCWSAEGKGWKTGMARKKKSRVLVIYQHWGFFLLFDGDDHDWSCVRLRVPLVTTATYLRHLCCCSKQGLNSSAGLPRFS